MGVDLCVQEIILVGQQLFPGQILLVPQFINCGRIVGDLHTHEYDDIVKHGTRRINRDGWIMESHDRQKELIDRHQQKY